MADGSLNIGQTALGWISDPDEDFQQPAAVPPNRTFVHVRYHGSNGPFTD